ncbi:MAG: WG repeat-containing protein [Lachnospiraceae bacterium]|nr:WG repeat-containing protein [Lachnospiraceae bacterium]
MSYPVLLTPTLTSDIDFATFSEDIFCIFDGKQYGYMKLSGEEITDYVYDAAFPFSEGLALVMREGKYGYINTEGDEVIPLIYEDAASFTEGLAYFSTEDEYGFMDKDGKVAFYLDCDSVSSFQEGLAYVCIDGKYGYIDQSGKIVIEPVFHDADYFKNGLAFINMDGYVGAINNEGEVVIPTKYSYLYWAEDYITATTEEGEEYYGLNGEFLKEKPTGQTTLSEDESIVEMEIIEKLKNDYDYLGIFNQGHAAVCKNHQYGIVDADGKLVVSPTYDYAMTFVDGSYCLKNDKYYLYDRNHNLIYESKKEADWIHMESDFYRIDYGNSIVVVDKKGEEILSAEYEYCADKIYGEGYGNFILQYWNDSNADSILFLGKDENAAATDILLKNTITPRIEEYRELIRGNNEAVIYMEEEYNSRMCFSRWEEDNYIKEIKLFSLEQSENPVLSYREAPIFPPGFPLSSSALYAMEGERLYCLVTGYECGGSLRGNYVCFWKDSKTGEIFPGSRGSTGGFGGYSSYSHIYRFQEGEIHPFHSESITTHTPGNYRQEELLENAHLFYNDEDIPYTRETIQEAERVTEYVVDGKQVTKKEYKEACDRYIYIGLF